MNPDIQRELKSIMATYRERADQALLARLPAEHIHPAKLHEAMHYAVFNGGKRVRPILAYATASALGGDLAEVDAVACAVELIHAYSLVHDDLPAMDNDDLRRGKPTCHKVYGDAMAILAGDALQTQAFHVLAHDGALKAIAAETRLKMIEMLAQASGSRGMAGGQAIDLSSVGQKIDLVQLEDMHIHKTGALIRASVMLGAYCCDHVDELVLKKLDHYAKAIGLSFQIQDDILDIEGSTEELGKPQGSDQSQDKPTYPSLLGLDGAKARAAELHEEALASLSALDEKADPLRWLSEYIVNRKN